MKPFATATDLEARWRPLEENEKKQAVVLLGDATAMIYTGLQRSGIEVDSSDEVQRINLQSVCCAMVRRAMDSMDDGLYKQASMTAGPYTESWTPANPNGDMYMTSAEKKKLGIGRQRIWSIGPKIDGGESLDTW